jgi:S-formylglutathione hydrolase
MTMRSTSRVTCGVALVFAAALWAHTSAAPQAGTVERIKVHGKVLEGNLEGDSPDRDVAVYLPPGYKTAVRRRYPVVYMLHGFTDDIDHWWGVVRHFVNVPVAMNKAIETGTAKEMILVMPNAYTRYQGSMYSNSVTTGNWEDFVVTELVAYVDSHYRTIANRNSRGLVGHSMGGYGAMRLGMKHPEVYSSIYITAVQIRALTRNFNWLSR